MIKSLYLKDFPMPIPPMSYPSFWLYLEDYKEEFERRILSWLKFKAIPLVGSERKEEILAQFSDLNNELAVCFNNKVSFNIINELNDLLERALLLIYYSGENPQIYADKENLLLRAKEIISAVIDEHVENKSYSQGDEDEYPKA